MGIFADFLTSRPMRIPQEREARIEIENLRDQGDAVAPAGFEGRTGWAILKVLGLTNQIQPPLVGSLLGYVPQDIDYGKFPVSPGTSRVLANQIAIDDDNRGLEDDLLEHLDLGNNKVNPASWPSIGPVELVPGDYVHRWSADESLFRDGDPVNVMVDGGSGGINLTAASGQEPTLKENVFRGLPALRFVKPTDMFLQSASDVTLFPSKRGTYVWLGRLTQWFEGPPFLKILSSVYQGPGDNQNVLALRLSGSDGQVRFPDGVVNVEEWTAGADGAIAINTPQLMMVIQDSDTTVRFRRNGVERAGGTIADAPPGVGPFYLGFWFDGSASGSNPTNLSHDLSVVLSYDRVLSASELNSLESTLMETYGIS